LIFLISEVRHQKHKPERVKITKCLIILNFGTKDDTRNKMKG
jgi:hypothetical protein